MADTPTETTTGAPRWVKVFGIVALAVVVLVVVLLLAGGPGGGHGPGRHAPSGGSHAPADHGVRQP